MAARAVTSHFDLLPKHLAIVPDGNGRWAEKRGLPRLTGHHAGAANMHRMVQYLNQYPIGFVTLYGFSTENWARPDAEVSGLFELLVAFIRSYLGEMHEKGVRLRHIGRLRQLPDELQTVIENAANTTKDNTRMTLNVAFNYGGRSEIVDATRRIVAEGISPEDITEETFAR